MALMARAYNQAQKFGAEMAIPDEATSLSADGADRTFTLALQIGERVKARSVVLATGARYRRLDVENLAAFEASCVHYWASPFEAKLCANQEVALIGAGNSAGQAAVYLASQGAKVSMLVRRSDPRSDDVTVSGGPYPGRAQHRSRDWRDDQHSRRPRWRARCCALEAP